jgi:hypothetical protein
MTAMPDQSIVSTLETVIAFVQPYRLSDRKYNAGHVLYAKGVVVELELEQQGRDLDEWLIEDFPPEGCSGVMVWEGECANKWCMNHGNDWEPRLHGTWRKPTAKELWSLVPQSC